MSVYAGLDSSSPGNTSSPYGNLTPGGGPPSKKTGGLLGALEHVAHIVAQKSELAGRDIKNIPGGIVQTVKVGGNDAVALAEGAPATDPRRVAADKLGHEILHQTVDSLQHPLRDPFATALTVLPVLHGVGRAAETGAAVTDAARAGEGARGVIRAATHTPEQVPRLLNVNGEQIPLHASKSPTFRLLQRVHDAIIQHALDTKPEGRVASYATKRAGGSLDETARYQQRMRAAPAAALETAAKRLQSKQLPGARRVNQAALELTSVNTPPDVAAAYHTDLARTQAARAAELAAKPVRTAADTKELALLRESAPRNEAVGRLYQVVHEKGLLTGNEHGDVIVNAEKFPKLARADMALAHVQGRGDEILTRYGIRTPDALQAATDAPGKYRAGATYVKPTPARAGIASQALKQETARLTSLERRHSDALAKDAASVAARRAGVSRLTATQPGEITVRTPMTEQATRARLDTLDQQYEEILKKFSPQVNPYSADQAAAETRARNTMRGRMAQGKRPATGRAIEGRIGGGSAKIKTISQEVRDLAESKLHDVIAAYPDHPVAQRARQLIEERQQLQDILNGRAESAFAGEHGPALPVSETKTAGEVPAQTGGKSIPLDNPHRERIVTLAHAIEEQRARVARMQTAAANRVEPTGVVGGETARPGRGHISYASNEPKAPVSPAAASTGPVVGEAKSPITSHANTGFNMEHGLVPADVSGQAVRHFRQIVRFVNTTERRNAAIRAGSDVKQSSRDVLAKIPGEDHAKLSKAIEEAIGKRKPTVDDLNGLHAALEAYREDLIPGLADQFAGDTRHPVGTSAATAAAERGLEAPGGYKFVDRNLLGDLARPSRARPGLIGRQMDNVNSAVTAATVYFKIGHVGTRVLTNAATNIVQGSAPEGARALAAVTRDMLAGRKITDPNEIAHTYRLYQSLTDEERARALAAAGQHGFAAMPHEGTSTVSRIAGKGAQWWAKHADAPFRFNSIAYEARKAGFDTPAKFRYMLDKLEDGGHGLNAAEAAKIDWVAKRANRAQIAYDRLNQLEQNHLARAFWFYPWIKGATMFAGHTAVEHPFKAAALSEAGQTGRQQQKTELGDLPSYEAGLFKVGESHGMPRVADFSTFSPFATAADMLDLVARPGGIAGQLNPVYGAADELINGIDQYGNKTKEPIVSAASTLFSPTPEAQILTAFLQRHQDQSKRMFPKSRRFSGTFDPAVRALLGPGTPRAINLAAAASAAARERSGR